MVDVSTPGKLNLLRFVSNNEESFKNTKFFKTINTMEQEYVDNLKLIVEEHIPNLQEKLGFNMYEVCGRIDLIYAYHDIQFLPDLRNATDGNLLDCFVKHKKLFDLYEVYIRYETYLICTTLYLQPDGESNIFECLQLLTTENKSIVRKRLMEYVDILVDLQESDGREKKYAFIINKIRSIIPRSVELQKSTKLIAEIVTTERKHVQRLRNLEKMLLNCCTGQYYKQKKDIMGKTVELCIGSEMFLKSLENCLYSFNTHDIMECFLKHKNTFEKYKEDMKTKNRSLTDRIIGENPDFSKYNYQAYDRLCKYDQLIANFEQIEIVMEVQAMIKTILDETNDILAIKLIKNENIMIEDQGRLIIRDNLKTKIKILNDQPTSTYCFLFEKSIVFTEDTTFVYIYHLLTNKIKFSVLPVPGSTKLQLMVQGKVKDNMYTLQGTPHQISKWFNAIQGIFRNQLVTTSREIRSTF